jgi:serine-type D-Ala-D-Ala carboxypeptidase (penicillin-binding protein 5/6)
MAKGAMISNLPRMLLAAALAFATGAALAAPVTIPPKAKPAPAATQGAKKDEGFQTAAPTAILIDGESGSVLFEKNADALLPPASLSKLMTT